MSAKYLVLLTATGTIAPVKFGVTQNPNIEQYRRQLQVGNPHRLEVVFALLDEDADRLEQALMAHLVHCRIGPKRRKWFETSVKEVNALLTVELLTPVFPLGVALLQQILRLPGSKRFTLLIDSEQYIYDVNGPDGFDDESMLKEFLFRLLFAFLDCGHVMIHQFRQTNASETMPDGQTVVEPEVYLYGIDIANKRWRSLSAPRLHEMYGPPEPGVQYATLET